MKWYWTKITLGALLIFCVGFAGITAFRTTKREVVRVAESNADISIPLPFVPFTFEGTKSGTFKRLILHRSDPHRVTGVDLIVKVPDPQVISRLSGCSLTVDNPTRINNHTTFRCAQGEADLEPFGNVIVEVDGAEPQHLPLVISKDVVKELQGRHAAEQAKQFEADRFRELGDSMRVLGRRMARASTDEERDQIKDQMDDLRDEMNDLQQNIVERATEQAEAAAEAATSGVKVEVGSEGVKVTAPTAPTPPAVSKDAKAPPVKPSGAKPAPKPPASR